MGVVDKIESALGMGGQSSGNHHHRDHTTEHQGVDTATDTTGTTTSRSTNVGQTTTQGSVPGDVITSGNAALANDGTYTTSGTSAASNTFNDRAAQSALPLGNTGEYSSTNAALSAQPGSGTGVGSTLQQGQGGYRDERISQSATAQTGSGVGNALGQGQSGYRDDGLAQATTAQTGTGVDSALGQGQGRYRDERIAQPNSAQTATTTGTGSTLGGQRDGQFDQPTAGGIAPGTASSATESSGTATTGSTSGTAKTDKPIARHDQAHDAVDFKPNLENPAAIPTAGGKNIGAGKVDHNATGTIGKDILNDDPPSRNTRSATNAANSSENAVQNDNATNVSDPSTNTGGPTSNTHPASAGFTTTGLGHDNVPGHARGF